MLKTVLSIFMTITLQATHPAIVKEEFLPISAPSCHAATIAETESGRLLCAWFAGTEEGNADVAIWLSALEKNWSHPKKVADAKDVPCWNPVLFAMESEALLFYKAGKNPQQWSGLLKRSYDDGKSWSKEEGLPAGILGPIKNKPLLLQDGTLLAGSSQESWMRWGCWIDITNDLGKSWTKSSPINVQDQLYGIIQPTLFLNKEGNVQLLARSKNIGYICKSESTDNGQTWSPASPTHLPNPNSAIDAVNLEDGRVVLVYNHSKENRYPLNVAMSKDGGQKWEMRVVLEDEPGEYSYPSVIQSSDGLIHVVYTWHRQKIKHVILDPKAL